MLNQFTLQLMKYRFRQNCKVRKKGKKYILPKQYDTHLTMIQTENVRTKDVCSWTNAFNSPGEVRESSVVNRYISDSDSCFGNQTYKSQHMQEYFIRLLHQGNINISIRNKAWTVVTYNSVGVNPRQSIKCYLTRLGHGFWR